MIRLGGQHHSAMSRQAEKPYSREIAEGEQRPQQLSELLQSDTAHQRPHRLCKVWHTGQLPKDTY
jgi:hypothetical protein